jgi:hypothetical protein
MLKINYSTTGLTKQQVTAVKTYQQIKNFPDTWKQDDWRDTENDGVTRCGAKLCYLGHVAQNDSGQWATNDPYSSHFSHLIVRNGDAPSAVEYMTIDLEGYDTVSIPVVSVMNRAAGILGLTEEEADELARPGNDLTVLRELIMRYLNVDPEDGMLVHEEISFPERLTNRPDCDYHVSQAGCPGCRWDREHA